MDAGIQILSRNGFRVEKGPNTGKTWGNFAGSDAERLSDLQWALDHPEASMIICSRGGYGMGRIIRQLDFSGFAKKPKWLIGFSDITLLHTRLQENGFASMHGPMLVHHTQMNQLTACLRQQDFLVRREGLRYPLENPFPKTKTAGESGILVGGNLSLLCYQATELSDDFFSNRIVFLEDVGESFHKIDRMLDQLFRTGKLRQVKAFVLGTFMDCPANGFPLSIAEMIREKAGNETAVFTGLPCGHASPSFPLLLGYQTEISGSGNTFSLSQEALPLIS